MALAACDSDLVSSGAPTREEHRGILKIHRTTSVTSEERLCDKGSVPHDTPTQGGRDTARMEASSIKSLDKSKDTRSLDKPPSPSLKNFEKYLVERGRKSAATSSLIKSHSRHKMLRSPKTDGKIPKSRTAVKRSAPRPTLFRKLFGDSEEEGRQPKQKPSNNNAFSRNSKITYNDKATSESSPRKRRLQNFAGESGKSKIPKMAERSEMAAMSVTQEKDHAQTKTVFGLERR